MTNKITAWDNLNESLDDGEVIETILFGEWLGMGDGPLPQPPTNLLMSGEDARPYMQSWEIDGKAYECEAYRTVIHTSKHVISIAPGDTGIDQTILPRNPSDTWLMSGDE